MDFVLTFSAPHVSLKISFPYTKIEQHLCINSYELLCDIFDTRLSFHRSVKELKYLENTSNFLEELNFKL